MNALRDPSKKASITSLLNPQDASVAFPAHLPNLAASVNLGQPHDHQNGAVYGSSYPNGSSFNLRAANWDMADEAAKRKGEIGTRQYPPQMNPINGTMYPEGNVPRMARGRPEEAQQYPVSVQVWNAPPNGAHMSYGAPVIPSMYSDERTALSGDYHAQNPYPPAFPEQSSSSATQAAYYPSQTRNSRDTASEAPQVQQDSRYQRSSYSQPPAMYSTTPYPQQLSGPHNHQHPQQPFLATQPHPGKQPSYKRQLPEEEAESAPPKKRAKAKPRTTGTDGTPGPSKRGYNARRRLEAAHIAAQNDAMMPTVTYTQAPTEKGKEKASDTRMQILSSAPGPMGENTMSLHPELQFARCMSNRYRSEQFPRCVSCTRRWAGDTCRFQGIRFFLKDQQRNIRGISFVESQKADTPTMNFPSRWNVPLKPEHIKRTKETIAEALLPTLRQEFEHLRIPEIIRRPRESEVRATCDTCMTSLFSSSWMCRLCGREACAECFAQVKELTEDRPGATQAEMLALQTKRDKHANINPFFLACTKRHEHQAKDFSAMSRFCKDELERAIADMELLLEQTGKLNDKQESSDNRPASASISGNTNGSGAPHPDGNAIISMNGSINGSTMNYSLTNGAPPLIAPNVDSLPDLNIQPPPLPGLAAALGAHSHGTAFPPTMNGSHAALPTSGNAPPPYLPPNLPEKIDRTPSWEIRRYTDAELSGDAGKIFSPIWTLGDPLVVTGILEKFKMRWTPEMFIEMYGDQTCLIIECQTDVNKRITVGEFFRWFGNYEGRTECWKLKDWPPSTDFKSAFPELYADFSRAVPVPDYVRRDGVFNIGSHFPSNTVAPDLGPKMYNALASSQGPGSKGSTRLHMDMADALNVMTYAAPCPDGSPGCAAWDLFRAQDSDRLRTFLKQKFGVGPLHDPIHGQQFYLDEDLRLELWCNQGIKSYRVYQRPGDAIFIPAGCAHQVSNMSDCVKVAIDYVSPENIERCEKLTREFREQNQSMAWKEDVLQLRTMMWFAWLSCTQQERLLTEARDTRAGS